MGNNLSQVTEVTDEYVSSSGVAHKSPTVDRASSMTCSISDKWRSGLTEFATETRNSPQVTRFDVGVDEAETQPEIREQSLVVVARSNQSVEQISPQTFRREQTPARPVMPIETDEEKLLSLCLMAMNLESLTEPDDTIHERIIIPPIHLTLVSCEYAAKRFFKRMDIEEIGSLSLDFSQERPKMIIRDPLSGTFHSGYLRAGQPSGSRKEIVKLQQTIENMAKVVQLLTSQIGVLEERVRYVECCDTATMKE